MAKKKDVIYGGYRNEAFYENFYKNMNAEDAYKETMVYLAKPTFKFEKDCAMKVYEKLFGKFQSVETKKIDNQEVEIERLKAIIANTPTTPNRSASPLETSNEVEKLEAIVRANPKPTDPPNNLRYLEPGTAKPWPTPIFPTDAANDNRYIEPGTANPLPNDATNLDDHLTESEMDELEEKNTEEKNTEEEKSITLGEFPKGMDKEAFKAFYFSWYEKSQGVTPTPLVLGKAFKKYQANEVQA